MTVNKTEVKSIYFGDNEEAALDFITRNWTRVASASYNADIGPASGWYVSITLDAAPVLEISTFKNEPVTQTKSKAKIRIPSVN